MPENTQLSLLLDEIKEIHFSNDFPKEADFQEFLDDAVSVLESEDESYRPKNDEGNPGGLLDFSSSTLPVLVVPDIHGRSDMLLKILEFKFDGTKTVLEGLNDNSLLVVCVGDAVHGEMRAYDRWLKSYSDWQIDVYAGPSMKEEMNENISVWRILMLLKKKFPANFHFLKGNHENVTNECGHGNYSFRKFVNEGQMCCDFIRQVYGDVILHLISLWEKKLPVCAVFSSFCVSHAEPAAEFKRDEVINSSLLDEVVYGFTWTRNDDAEKNSCKKTLKNLNSKARCKGCLWFGGHRPVKDSKFNLRQDGAYVQLHNPQEMNVALVVPGKKFDPEKDIRSL